jgi:NADPH-dependent glutamate synthase beta subunit-like oxidoreductase/ferredoxin
MPTVRIDGRQVRVAEGETLLHAAASIGITIPTLCNLDGEPPFTSCMLCVVEDTATGRLLPACSAPAAEGAEVRTSSEPVRAARRSALELLLAEHVGDCEAPCTLACPVGIDIPAVIRLLGRGAAPQALEEIRSAAALPALACLLCSAPCESACRRSRHDQPVAIREVMLHVAGPAADDATPVDPASPAVVDPEAPAVTESSGKTAAVIGAGAAGLSAAYHLSLGGHGCRVFEAGRYPGGSFHDPAGGHPGTDRLIHRDVEMLVTLGVRFQWNAPAAEVSALCDIMDSHDATIAAAGAGLRPLLEQAAVRIPEPGLPVTGALRWQTSAPNLFAAGSLLEPGCSFVQALAQGKAAAACADQYLRGLPVTGPRHRFHSQIGRLLEGELPEFLAGSADIPRSVSEAGLTPRSIDKDRSPPASGYTRGEAVREASRCLRCDCGAKESCRLRIYAEEYGARARRFRIGARRRFRRISQHPEIIFEPGKCIKCGICVRITARENEEVGLAFLNRGYDLEVGAPFGELLSRALERSGDLCVRACPTGALYFRQPSRKEQ